MGGALQTDIFTGRDIVLDAIELLRAMVPPEGFYLAFSGGKDSVVLLDLAQRAGVRFDAHMSLTTLDPPDVLRFVARVHPAVMRHKPARSFFALVPSRGLPRRQSRWCCQALKERGFGTGRIVLTGIRRAESTRRAARRVVETCLRERKTFIHPLFTWSDAEIWHYIRANRLPYCSLYDEGRKRIGCIACPMSSTADRAADLARWPRVRDLLMHATEELYADRRARNPAAVARWASAAEMFEWWLLSEAEAPTPGQMSLTA